MVTQVPRQPSCWKYPPQGSFNINIDGAVSTKRGYSAVRMVIRDYKGQLCVARAVRIPDFLSPLETELMAIEEALLRCRNTGFLKGSIVTDSKVVADLINSKEAFVRAACFIVDDLRALLSSCTDVSCNFDGREANKVAHELAKFALSCNL